MLAAAALLALAGALALPVAAEAQTETTLASNIGQGSTENRRRSGYFAQGFTTGSNESGYTLTGIDVVSASSSSFAARVCGANSAGLPTSTCTTLTAPGAFAAGTVSFTAPPNTTLTKDAPYAVVVGSGPELSLDFTTSDGEDTGYAAGWTIADRSLRSDSSDFSTSLSSDLRSLRIAIKGAGALPSLSIADAAATEGDDLSFTVTLSAAAAAEVTATWTASIGTGDTAVAADLGTTTTGTVSVSMGTTTGTFTVSTTEDSLDEDDETFTVTLSNVSSNAQLAADPTARGTITDDDNLPELAIGLGGTEEANTPVLSVSVTPASGREVMVTWTATIESDDTAEAADFTDLSTATGTVTIPAGQSSHLLFLRGVVADDSLDEDDETFTVTLSSPVNATLSNIKAGRVTIQDDDDPPTVTVADGTATEGDKVEFVVTLSAVSGRDVEVDYATSVGTGQTATSGTDFTAASGTLTIEEGDETGTIEVQTTEDSTEEEDETFTLTISDPANAGISDATAKGTITDNDGTTTPTCTLNTGDLWCGVVTVAEIKTTGDALVGHGFADGAGLSAGGLAGNPDETMFSVGDNDYTISAAYIQVPTGTTLTGTLYVLLSADLTDADKAGLLLPVDDTTTPFEFSGATKGTTGLYSWGLSGLTWSAGDTVTIRVRPRTLSVADASDAENDGEVEFTVTLSEAAATAVTATWTASIETDDTAVAADLGTTKTGTVTVAIGDTTGTFEVPVVNDSTDEGDETFTVTLSGVSSNATLGTDPTAKGTINDDDGAMTPTNCTLNTGDVWCGAVTVGTQTAGTITTGHGFSSITGDSFGTLTDNSGNQTFTHGTQTYVVSRVVVGAGSNLAGILEFRVERSSPFDAVLDDDHRAKLALHVAGSTTPFAFRDTTGYNSSLGYVWSNSGLDWSSATTVTVRLRELPDAPTGFEAAVGNAQVGLTWDAPASGANITRHEFRYKTGNGSYPTTWTPITASAPGGANEASYTVTRLTNEIAHTFELRAWNDSGGSAADEDGPVTPTPGICDRTQQVRESIIYFLEDEHSLVRACAEVTVADLARLIYLEAADQGITSLKLGDFAGLTSLATLELNDNNFTTLPVGVFSGLTELTSLILRSGALSSLPAGVFSGLTSLSTLNLQVNDLEALPAGLFSGLTALVELRLNHNSLEELLPGVFSGLSSLADLDLFENALEELPPGVFSNLTSLEHIRLDGNDLEALPAGLFTGLTGLDTLKLGDNPNTDDTLPLTVTVEKVGTDQARAEVLAGAPTAVDFTPTVANGALPASDTKLAVAAGSVEGTPVTVTRTSGTTESVTVDIDLSTQPSVPANHTGYEFVKATSGLPAGVLSAVGNNAPVFDPATAEREVAENSAAGTDVGDPIRVRLFFVDGPRGFCQRHGKSYLTRRRRGGEGGGGGLLTGRAIPSAYRWAWCRWYSRVVEVPVRIEVAAGFVAPGASEPPRLQPSWPLGGSRPAHG